MKHPYKRQHLHQPYLNNDSKVIRRNAVPSLISTAQVAKGPTDGRTNLLTFNAPHFVHSGAYNNPRTRGGIPFYQIIGVIFRIYTEYRPWTPRINDSASIYSPSVWINHTSMISKSGESDRKDVAFSVKPWPIWFDSSLLNQTFEMISYKELEVPILDKDFHGQLSNIAQRSESSKLNQL